MTEQSHWAEEAVEALWETGGDDGPPVWGSFDGVPGDLDGLVVHQEPTDLIGAVAPPSVWAVGILAAGTAWSFGDVGPGGGALSSGALSSGAPGCGLPAQRVRICCVVTRHGDVAGRLRLADGTVDRTPPGAGRFLDTLHRCLGLPTPPADLPAAVGLGLAWMAALAETAANGPIPWSEAVTLHPAWPAARSCLRAIQDAGTGERPPEAVALGATTGPWDWEEVRRRCASSTLSLDGIDPRLAAWMDGGMLCRWLCEELRRFPDLMAATRRAVCPHEWEEVLKTVIGESGDDPVGGPGGHRSSARRRSGPSRTG